MGLTNFIELPIGKLVKADWNYKEANPDLIEKLKANIKRNGQIENVIVRKLDTGFFEVVNGNHRLTAFTELGIDKVICYNLGSISLAMAQRIAIETNETKFETNNLDLANLIKEINEDFELTDLTETMPFSLEELENFTTLADFDWKQYDFDGSGDEGSEKEAFKELTFSVPEETFNLWLKWKDRANRLLGYDSDTKCFEFAIVEVMNIPEDSLK